MTLVVKHPPTYRQERTYTYYVIFKEFLGLDYRSITEDRKDTQITTEEADAPRLLVSDILFQVPNEKWLTNEALPLQPLERWAVLDDLREANILSKEINVLFGKKLDGKRFCLQDEKGIAIGLDVFGSIFFMLTRYEELVRKDRDQHNRFPATASIAYQEGFLEKPIVNEYLEILWSCLTRLWPRLSRKPRSYHLLLTHDVDHISAVMNERWTAIIRSSIADLFKRKDGRLALKRLEAAFVGRFNNYRNDPFNIFDFMMDVSEQNGIQSSFYFMAVEDFHDLDGRYVVKDKFVLELMKKIIRRGHKIGFHGSYDSYLDRKKLASEVERLVSTLAKLDYGQSQWGGRQHFLRWENPTTWQNWADVGMDFDSTLSFADFVGFRCGTCYEFPVFNLVNRQQLSLYEYPLVAMDSTLFHYMDLKPNQAGERLFSLAKICKHYNGNMVVLWHNTNLIQEWQISLYQRIIADLS